MARGTSSIPSLGRLDAFTSIDNFMHWVAPSEQDIANVSLEKRLWAAADPFRANSSIKSQEYSALVLDLIFLRFIEVRYVDPLLPRLVSGQVELKMEAA